MRYAIARYKQSRRELAYRIYLTDAIQAMGEGKYIKTRFADVISPRPVDNRPALEIAQDLLKGAGLEVVSNECI